ncbi:sel1 repeat family protein [Xanthomonas sp. LMG 12462]|uniref:sel1 repeat family protein n=1 Tax=Xanthomonas sp. LMG 12462 TaxID=1591134 RepID=UPI0012659644|nr:sel1 repeat family protein [Xanthomonas sp. LMG 12462]
MKNPYYILIALAITGILIFAAKIDEKGKKGETQEKTNSITYVPQRPLKTSQQLSVIQAPEGKLEDIAPELKKSAEKGNAKSALALYLKLSTCDTALHTQISPDEIKAYASAGISMEKYANSMEKSISECTGASEEDLKRRGKWLEKSAMLGDLQAKLMYASDPEAIVGDATDMLRDPEKVIDYKKKAVKFLSDAASSGSPDGLMKMGDAYNDGILLPKDQVRAYAFYRATEMTTSSDFSNILSKIEPELTPAQISQGNKEAIHIYQNCCK